MEAVPCIRAESLTPDEARAYRLADNKVADASYWDDKTLFGELDGLDDLGGALLAGLRESGSEQLYVLRIASTDRGKLEAVKQYAEGLA